MYNEIVAAGMPVKKQNEVFKFIYSINALWLTLLLCTGVDYYFDQDTKTAIGYLEKDSGDGWTKAGTWFTFNDKSSIAAVSKYIS